VERLVREHHHRELTDQREQAVEELDLRRQIGPGGEDQEARHLEGDRDERGLDPDRADQLGEGTREPSGIEGSSERLDELPLSAGDADGAARDQSIREAAAALAGELLGRARGH
jgi:hypothetical protein